MKKYDIPEELMELQYQRQAAEKLRDLYVKLPFGFKKAKKCALDAVRAQSEFWHRVPQLYPELEGKNLTAELNERYIVERAEGKA